METRANWGLLGGLTVRSIEMLQIIPPKLGFTLRFTIILGWFAMMSWAVRSWVGIPVLVEADSNWFSPQASLVSSRHIFWLYFRDPHQFIYIYIYLQYTKLSMCCWYGSRYLEYQVGIRDLGHILGNHPKIWKWLKTASFTNEQDWTGWISWGTRYHGHFILGAAAMHLSMSILCGQLGGFSQAGWTGLLCVGHPKLEDREGRSEIATAG